MKFRDLNVKEKIKVALQEMNFETMMPIQEEAIPVILDGKNIIGEAATGTGKTGAFLIPILSQMTFDNKGVETLIVTPTRELALQIVDEVSKIGKYLNIRYATLVGGMSISDQIKKLNQKPHIVVGTLGRINDHIRSKRLDLSRVKYFVLDEADEMLKEGFKEDITAINNEIPNNKQTLLFSATYTKTILKLSEDIMDSYEFVSVKDNKKTATNIDQYYMVMKEKNKFSNLVKLLDIDKPKMAIIFGRTKRRADELGEALAKCGYKAACIHGDLSQGQRNMVMRKFREGSINILVATDVAARGIDISGVSHVYNFDLPQEVEFYVHRVGRTGRANDHGISYSFIKDSELSHIKRIEKENNFVIKEKPLPSYSEWEEAKNGELVSKIEKKLSKLNINKNQELAAELIEEFGALELVSVLIDALGRQEFNDVSLTGEPGVKVRGERGGSGSHRKKNYVAERNVRKRERKRNPRKDGNRNFRRTGNRNK